MSALSLHVVSIYTGRERFVQAMWAPLIQAVEPGGGGGGHSGIELIPIFCQLWSGECQNSRAVRFFFP